LLETFADSFILSQNILISLESTKPLGTLNDVFKKAFSQDSQPPYFPHLSLLYSDLSGTEAQKIIEVMEQDGTWKEEAPGCWFGREKIRDVQFEEIELWDCNGPVGDWKKLNSMKL